MSRLKIVLDTNALLRTISRRSEFSPILNKLYNGEFDLFVTNEILLEYEEKVASIFSLEIADQVLGSIGRSTYVKKIDVHFRLNLIDVDVDDNKFTDCYFAANANYLVSNDKHFNAVKNIDFPKFNILSLEQFAILIKLY